ncbi:MAG: MBL fold metallo-hydrolase [Thermodesulfobacteriota bacterium]|nr:MBL fold metallo-hydrolase [Thermodesulfobacteriota bacterium]
MNIENIKGLHMIKVPSPWSPPGPCNCYLLEDKNLTLIDTGPYSNKSLEYLIKKLGKIGYSLKDIKKIIITHGHADHFGLASIIQRASNADVMAHKREVSRIEDPLNSLDFRLNWVLEFLKSYGSPPSILEEIKKSFSDGVKFSKSVKITKPLEHGDKLDLKKFDIEIIHSPGHTIGMICLYDRKNKLLFSGDHIIEHITPVPFLQPNDNGSNERFESLSHYLNSLKMIRELDVDYVLPAHGSTFTDLKNWIDDVFKFHEIRKTDMAKIIADGEKSAYEVCTEYFNELSGYDVICGISEVVNHIDMLNQEGILNIRKKNKIFYYSMKRK